MRFFKILPLTILFAFASENIDENRIVFSEHENTTCNVEFMNLMDDAIRTHPSISMAQEMEKGAEYQLESAMWEYFPTPSVDVSYKTADQRRIIARLDQPLWTGGKIDAAYDSANAKKFEAENTLDESKFKILDNGIKSFKEYLIAKNKIVVLDQNKQKYLELSEMLQRMMTAGLLSQTDKNLLNSKMANLSSDLIVTKSKYKIARIQLEILTGKPLNCQVNFDYKKVFKTNLDIDKLLSDLNNFHPSLKIMDAKIKTAIAEEDASKAKLYPTVSLRGEHISGTIYEDGTDQKSQNLAYVAFTMTSGAGLSSLSNIEKAKVNVSKVKYEKFSKQKDLIDNLMSDYTAYITATTHLNILKEDIKTTYGLYESNRRLFETDKKNWVDIVNTLAELYRLKVKESEVTVEKMMLEYSIALKTGYINLNTLEVSSDL